MARTEPAGAGCSWLRRATFLATNGRLPGTRPGQVRQCCCADQGGDKGVQASAVTLRMIDVAGVGTLTVDRPAYVEQADTSYSPSLQDRMIVNG